MTKVFSFARVWGFVLLLAATCFGGYKLAAATPGEFPSGGGMAAKLQPFVDKQVIAGAVVLVADKEKVLDLETVGYADAAAKKPMTANNLFYIASMTKCFTATALMMMVDEGKVDINDPLEKYLPEFKGQMVEEADHKGHPHPPQHPITVKEVMDHTAALANGPWPARSTLEAEVKDIAKKPLQWEPGTKMKYSIGPAIGGRIVEVVSGIPYCQFIQQRLLEPLSLKDTTFWPDAEQASRLALTYKYNPETKTLEPLNHRPELLKEGKIGTVPPLVFSQFGISMISAYENHYANPAGSLFSTAKDAGTFCQMLLNGGTWQGKRYISETAFKQMTSNQTGDILVGNGALAYGLGFFVQRRQEAGGCSVGSFGHHGARKTKMWIDPQNGIAMVLMVQCSELVDHQERDLYAVFQKEVTARFGKTGKRDAPAQQGGE
jgi:CubicO group peptidase (beta-lactamase class C family)